MANKLIMVKESATLLDSISSDNGDVTEGETTQVCSACNPRKDGYRFLVLCLLCLVIFGLYFCFDMPAALERTIIQVMRVDTTRYELLYSLYSWPAVFLIVVGGVLLDKVLGLRVGLLSFLVLTCLGQFLFAFGAILDQYWLMVLGRLILGTGIECSLLCVDVFAADLYTHHQLSFAMGLIYAMAFTAEALNFNLTHRLYDAFTFLTNRKTRIGAVLLLGCSLCLLSLVSGLAAVALHYWREKLLKRKREEYKRFSLKDIKDFSLSYWLFAVIPSVYYSGVFTFLTITQVFFEEKYGYRTVTANLVSSLTYILPIMGPVVGILIDWTGYKISWGVFAVLLSLLSHYVYTFSGPDYYIPFLCNSLIGVSVIVFNCSTWTLGFLLVKEHQTATAYGVAYAFYNLGLALTPVCIGLIVDSSGYLFVQLFFSSVTSLCLLLITALYIVDSISGGGKLNIPGRWKKRSRH